MKPTDVQRDILRAAAGSALDECYRLFRTSPNPKHWEMLKTAMMAYQQAGALGDYAAAQEALASLFQRA